MSNSIRYDNKAQIQDAKQARREAARTRRERKGKKARWVENVAA